MMCSHFSLDDFLQESLTSVNDALQRTAPTDLTSMNPNEPRSTRVYNDPNNAEHDLNRGRRGSDQNFEKSEKQPPKLLRSNTNEVPPKPPPRLRVAKSVDDPHRQPSVNKFEVGDGYKLPRSTLVNSPPTPSAAPSSESGFNSVYLDMKPLRLIDKIKNSCSLVESNEADLSFPIYQVPLRQLTAPQGCILYQVEFPNLQTVVETSEKAVILVGSDMAGKSTMIDAAINYGLDVQWTDALRFRLANSGPTTTLTAYRIPHYCGSLLKCTLTLIDTPGISDSGESAPKVEQLLHSFVSELAVSRVHLICLVASAVTVRLPAKVKSSFDAILALFDQDVHQNVLPVATFADSKQPAFLQALRDANVPHRSEGCRMNNAALYAANNDGFANFNSCLWKMTETGFKSLFSVLESVAPCYLRGMKQHSQAERDRRPAGQRARQEDSLATSSQVENDRQDLEVLLSAVIQQVRECAGRLQQLRNEQQCFERCRAEVYNARDEMNSVRTAEAKKVQLKPGHYVTNCLICNMTCHDDCCYANNSDKHKCSAMTVEPNPLDARCTVCPARCSWRDHVNQPFFYQWHTLTKTLQELKEAYEAAQQKRLTMTQVVAQVEEEKKQAHKKLFEILVKARKIIFRLDRNSSKPFSLMSYLDKLIQGEEKEKAPGYEDRIKALQDAKMEVEKIRDVTKSENVDETIDVVLRGDTEHPDFQKLKRYSAMNSNPFLGIL